MATVTLDFSRISNLGPSHGGRNTRLAGEKVLLMVRYFDELRKTNGQDDLAICRALQDAVEQERLQPYVFSVFISWCKDPAVLVSCMAYKTNAAVRSAAIKSLGRRLRKSSKQANNELLGQILGDTQSLLTLFAESSVQDVKHLCVTISNSGRFGRVLPAAFQERQRAVERLLRALLPAVYPTDTDTDTEVKTAASCRDQRPLQPLYAIMLPACSAEFVEAVLDARDQSNPLFRRRSIPKLLRSHRALFKKRAEDHLYGRTASGGAEDPDAYRYIDPLLNNDRVFALAALHGRADGTITRQRWGITYSEAGIALGLVERLVKRRQASKESVAAGIRDLIQLAFDVVAANPPSTNYYQKSDEVELWRFALDGWTRRPEMFEDTLVQGLRLGLGSSPMVVPRDYLSAATRPDFPEALRPGLLQRYCLHVGKPDEGCDIFAKDTSFAPLANRSWPLEVFSHLEVEQSVRILKQLEAVNPEYNFLVPHSHKVSVINHREMAGQKNFNVGLLLTKFQRKDPDVIRRTRGAVDELRKKSATAREQSDRAEYAEAACAYAIATGDLDLYGETVAWQQRFVREPLTTRRIFGRPSVLTEEGIEMLSALQDPKNIQSDVLRVSIRKADDILKTFYETHRLAEREPSFESSDWHSVRTLFRAVYDKRVQHLHTMRDSAQTAIVWSGFLDAISWMNIAFLHEIHVPAIALLRTFSPGLLATAAQDLLRIGTERRKQQDHAEAANLLDRMSYKALRFLARSSSPALASELIVQTIMDRPDASSWHRQLLSGGFLKRLRAQEAQEVLLNLATAISEKLEEQSYVQVGEAEQPKHAPPRSLVKVTTVKYLAQLLNQAEFISNETAIEVLVELFKNAQHRDIRLAALESLLSLLDGICTEIKAGWTANPTADTIIRALETAVPVTGSINERRPPREEDWVHAEATGIMPEISEAPRHDLRMPPLMEALVLAADGKRYGGLRRHMQAAFVERIVLPILRQSQREHTRWVKLFLATYKAPFVASDVPLTPVAVCAWHSALSSYYPLVAPAILADFNAYAVHQIAPDAKIEQFTAALRADVELRKRADVQHWLFAYGSTSFSQPGTIILLDLMKKQYDARLRVDYGPAMDIVFQHAKIFLDHYEEHAEVWERIMACLAPSLQTFRDAAQYRLWRETHGTILSRISDEIWRRRTQDTQDMHQILPSRTKIELWLLPFLALNGNGKDKDRGKGGDGDGNASDFVVQLELVLLGLLEGQESQILGWSDMADDVLTISGRMEGAEVKSQVANELGKLADRDHIAARAGSAGVQTRQALDLIKVKVAMRLFDEVKDVEAIKSAGRERLKEWRASGSDAIRERVFRWEGRPRIEVGSIAEGLSR